MMIKYTQEQLEEMFYKHWKWLEDKDSGKRADLSDANLRHADLSGANLSGTDLSGADLSGAGTDKRYISISCIGSRRATTTYCFDDDMVWCGCFKGSLAAFASRVRETHEDEEQYLKEYTGAIEYIKRLQEQEV